MRYRANEVDIANVLPFTCRKVCETPLSAAVREELAKDILDVLESDPTTPLVILEHLVVPAGTIQSQRLMRLL